MDADDECFAKKTGNDILDQARHASPSGGSAVALNSIIGNKAIERWLARRASSFDTSAAAAHLPMTLMPIFRSTSTTVVYKTRQRPSDPVFDITGGDRSHFRSTTATWQLPTSGAVTTDRLVVSIAD